MVTLDVNYLFPDLASWNSETLRDEFLSELLQILRISDVASKKYVISDSIYDYLVDLNSRAPYIKDEPWKNVFFPIIYAKFARHFDLSPDGDPPLSLSNELSVNNNDEDLKSHFIRQLSGCYALDPNTLFLLSRNNARIAADGLVITTSEGIYHTRPVMPAAYLKGLDYSSCWLKTSNDTDTLSSLITLFFDLYDSDYFDFEYCREFDFEPAFVKDIYQITDPKMRRRVITSIAKRLRLRRESCGRNTDINDHYIDQTRDWRFYVGGCRIHYSESDDCFTFSRFYDESEHDDYKR